MSESQAFLLFMLQLAIFGGIVLLLVTLKQVTDALAVFTGAVRQLILHEDAMAELRKQAARNETPTLRQKEDARART